MKLLSLLILLLLNCTILFAQNGENTESNISIISYSKELGLTKKQVKEITDIIKEYKAKVKEKEYLLNSKRPSDMETIKKLKQEFRAKEEAILTQKQKVKWNLICKEAKDIKMTPAGR